MLENFFKNKFKPIAAVAFFISHRKEIGWAIFAAAALYGGFLLYSRIFKMKPQDLDVRAIQTGINENIYNEVWRDFSERPARLQGLMDKEYRNPFLGE